MLVVDKHCSDICCDEFSVPQGDRKSKQVKELWHGEFFCNQHGERLVILNAETVQICEWLTKLEAIKMQFVCAFFHVCRKFELLISQGSVATCLSWDVYCHMSFIANVVRFPAVQRFWKSVKFDKVTDSSKVGTFSETQCSCGHGCNCLPSQCRYDTIRYDTI